MAAFLASIALAGAGGGQCLGGQSAAPLGPSVRVVSVSVLPDTIHKQLSPRSALVKVVLRCLGPVPADAKAELEVSTYSTEPPGNDAVYTPQTTVLQLKKGKVVCKVRMEAGPRMVSGSIVVCAEIRGHGTRPGSELQTTISGFPIKPPANWADGRATVKTLVP